MLELGSLTLTTAARIKWDALKLVDVRKDLETFCIWGHASPAARATYKRDGCLSKKQLRYRARKARWAKFKKRMGFK